MNDSELEAMLRTSRTPERDEDYWREFPETVMRRLPQQREAGPAREPWLAAFAWGSAVACACVLIGFAIGQTNRQAALALLRRGQNLRREMAVAPTEFCAKIQSEQRLRYLVANTPWDL
jgi:hypothetical protein